MVRIIPVTEQHLGSKPLRVDRALNTIFSVKIIGFDSDNGRRYTAEALKKAVKLYENVKVNVDHPDNPEDSRSVYDRIGKLTNVRFVEGKGLFGDLWLLPSHKLTDEVYEAASLMPDLFGLSHNAQGEGEEDEQGVFIVKKITEVRHVDLVADPATTHSLSEAVQKKPILRSKKMKEEDKEKEPLEAEYEDKGTAEGDGGMHEQVMDILSGEGDDMEKAAAIVSLFSDEETPEAEDENAKEEEGDSSDEKEDTPEAEDEEMGDDEEETKESRKFKGKGKGLQEQFSALKKKLYLNQLLESNKVPADKALIADLSKMSYPLIRTVVKRLAAAHRATRPKSGHPMQENKQKSIQMKTGTDLYQWLQN